MQSCFFAINNQSVAGVMPALKANHTTHLIGQHVDNFALTLVAPLSSENDNNFSHYLFRINCVDRLKKLIPTIKNQHPP